MKRLIISFLFSVSIIVPAWGQDTLIGTWETEDGEPLIVAQIRDDIVITNEYYEGELSCIFIHPYSVNGDEIIQGEGANWEYDPLTGEFEFYEDFAALTTELVFAFEFSGEEVTFSRDNRQILQSLVNDAESLALDSETDLGLPAGGPDPDAEISDKEIEDLFNLIFVASLAYDAGYSLTDLGLEKGVTVEEGFFEFTKKINLDLLGLDESEVDLMLEPDATLVDLLIALIEVESGQELDEAARTELAAERADQFTPVELAEEARKRLRQVTYTRSDREIIIPPGMLELPNNITAVTDQSWGRLKERYRR